MISHTLRPGRLAPRRASVSRFMTPLPAPLYPRRARRPSLATRYYVDPRGVIVLVPDRARVAPFWRLGA